MGNLPNSRTVTLNPSDSFPSSLGNELQDMVILLGARTGSRPYPFGGGRFVMRAGTPTLASDNSWGVGGLSTVVSDMQFPVGTVITSATFGYSRNSGNLTFFIKKRDLFTGTGPVTVVTKVINTGTGYASTLLDSTTPSSTLPYTVQASTQVWLEAQLDTVGQVFNGAVVVAGP